MKKKKSYGFLYGVARRRKKIPKSKKPEPELFPSGGTTPEVQRTLRGRPCGTLRCVTLRCAGGNPRGGTVFKGLQPSEARLRRSEARLRRAKRGFAERKRGRPAERSEAPPRLRRAKRGRAKVIGRSPLQKNSKRFHQKAQVPGEPLIFSIECPCRGDFRISGFLYRISGFPISGFRISDFFIDFRISGFPISLFIKINYFRGTFTIVET